ncbi:MAG TPA: hypothetical protein VJ815_02495 [Acidimicrobiia bacterium]|nr:hypothetical protein [Acidimicrobiia bacterium]
MMKPNPYLLVPSLVLGALVGWMGFVITNVSCRADQPAPAPGCPLTASLIGIGAFIVASAGLLVVLALTARSIAEYRQERDRQDG